MSEPRKQEIEELCVPLECQADTSGDFGFSRDLNAEAWRDARLDRCPIHPHGGCSIRGHGTYEVTIRQRPRGILG